MRTALLALSLLLMPGSAMAYEIVEGDVPTALVDDLGTSVVGRDSRDGHRTSRPTVATPAMVEGATMARLLAFVDASTVPRSKRLAAALRLSPLHREADPASTIADPTAYKGRWVRQAYASETDGGTRILFAYHWLHESENAWRERVYFVMDGGVAHFEVVWDPKTKTFSRLSIHGEA